MKTIVHIYRQPSASGAELVRTRGCRCSLRKQWREQRSARGEEEARSTHKEKKSVTPSIVKRGNACMPKRGRAGRAFGAKMASFVACCSINSRLTMEDRIVASYGRVIASDADGATRSIVTTLVIDKAHSHRNARRDRCSGACRVSRSVSGWRRGFV